MQCNLCQSTRFKTYRGRPNEQCEQCGSKARHRVAMDVYSRFVLPHGGAGGKLLHLAPERFLAPALQEAFGRDYVAADAEPQRYPHVDAIRLFLPQGFSQFQPGEFKFILHNHVLEHIPGDYREHLEGFCRILASGGLMVFSVPGPYMDRETVQGGENLASDAERLEKFLQEDHYKLFGRDFVAYLGAMPGGKLLEDGVTDARRAELAVRPGKAPFFLWQKD